MLATKAVVKRQRTEAKSDADASNAGPGSSPQKFLRTVAQRVLQSTDHWLLILSFLHLRHICVLRRVHRFTRDLCSSAVHLARQIIARHHKGWDARRVMEDMFRLGFTLRFPRPAQHWRFVNIGFEAAERFRELKLPGIKQLIGHMTSSTEMDIYRHRFGIVQELRHACTTIFRQLADCFLNIAPGDQPERAILVYSRTPELVAEYGSDEREDDPWIGPLIVNPFHIGPHNKKTRDMMRRVLDELRDDIESQISSGRRGMIVRWFIAGREHKIQVRYREIGPNIFSWACDCSWCRWSQDGRETEQRHNSSNCHCDEELAWWTIGDDDEHEDTIRHGKRMRAEYDREVKLIRDRLAERKADDWIYQLQSQCEEAIRASLQDAGIDRKDETIADLFQDVFTREQKRRAHHGT